MHTIAVTEACTGCRQCVDVCFVNAIGWDEKEERPVLAYPQDCQICVYCEKLCPANALAIVPDWQSKYNPRILSTDRRQGHEKID